MLARGYIKRSKSGAKRRGAGRAFLAKEIAQRFHGLDIERETQRISREFCKRYSIVKSETQRINHLFSARYRIIGWAANKQYLISPSFISFRRYKDRAFYRTGRLFAGSYREWRRRKLMRQTSAGHLLRFQLGKGSYYVNQEFLRKCLLQEQFWGARARRQGLVLAWICRKSFKEHEERRRRHRARFVRGPKARGRSG